MKMKSPIRWILMLGCSIALCVLVGCGGSSSGDIDNGGGGGGDSSAVSLSVSEVNFNYAMGGPAPPEQTVNVSFSGPVLEIGYPPGVSVPNWLSVSREGEFAENPMDINLSVKRYTVTAGNHQTVLRFVAKHLDGSVIGYRDLKVTCAASNQLSFEETELNFTHTYAAVDDPAGQSVTIFGDDIQWVAEADQSWVVLGDTNGTAPGSLSIGVHPTGLATGNHAAVVTLRDPSSGQSATLAVNLTVEPHRLLVGDNGVALTSFPTAPSALSRTVTVTDNADVATPWSASSDQAWLTVTASGYTDGPLTLTADPAGLTAGEIHYATVTVGSGDASISNTEKINVGLYVADSDPVVTELPSAGGVVADPVRPYVYACSTGSISVFNIYTGENLGQLFAGTKLYAETISSDGGTLYVYDDNDKAIVPIDLHTWTAGAEWPGIDLAYYCRLSYARFNGRGVVLTNKRQVFDAVDGTLVATFTSSSNYDVVMAACPNHSSFYAIDTGLSGSSFDLIRHVGHYSVINDTFSVTPTHHIATPFLAGTDIAVNKDETKIYLSPGVRSFVFDGAGLAEGTEFTHPLGPPRVAVGPDSKLYVGVRDESSDIFRYDTNDTPDGAYSVPGDFYSFAISGDGLRLIAVSGDSHSGYWSFIAIAP
jgi:hypothetical protein